MAVSMDVEPRTYQFGNLPKLPLEVLDQINEYLTGGNPHKPYYFGSVDSALCEVNSLWNRIFTPLLYAQFSYHGNINNVWSLWGFLRTLSERPDLAAQVNELTITTWDIYEPFVSTDMAWDTEFITEFSHLFRVEAASSQGGLSAYFTQAGHIRAAYRERMKAWHANAHYMWNQQWAAPLLRAFAMPQIPDTLPDSILTHADRALYNGQMHQGHQGPLAALTIALCPNLRRLNYDLWDLGQDSWFSRLVGYATGRNPLPPALANNPPMQNLEVVRLAARMVKPIGAPARRGLSEIADLYKLPAIRELTWMNAVMPRLFDPPQPGGGSSPNPSTIQRLTINGDLVRGPQIPSLLPWMQNLRQLSLKMTGDYAHTTHDPSDGPIRWSWLWKQLYFLRDQLEFLDLYQRPFPLTGTEQFVFETRIKGGKDGKGGKDAKEMVEMEGFCPPLAEFSKLVQLNITPLGLYGYDCQHAQGKRLRAHLPPKLISLGLYTDDDGKWVDNYMPNLATELENIAIGGSEVEGGTLKAIVIDDPKAGENITSAKLETAARRLGMFYSGEARTFLFYAGTETIWGGMNDPVVRKIVLKSGGEERKPERVIPKGMVVHDVKGTLRF
ncbi:hypothetical protein BJY00DRAFT_308543 [Aspergillus carlsbadensis]|nr:hypothetical protein BJY00DRAFT_308543 [Aspergillus carlsbadensis]